MCTAPSDHTCNRRRNCRRVQLSRSLSVERVSDDDQQKPKVPPLLTSHANVSDVYPESFGYRVKRILLGKPYVTEQLSGERLNRIVALGVLAPDCISSSAYGTERS